MSNPNTIMQVLREFTASVFALLRAAFVIGIPKEDRREASRLIDPDFERWLHSDPLVTNNPASQYGDKKPGYFTRNGRGSMEIGAVKD